MPRFIFEFLRLDSLDVLSYSKDVHMKKRNNFKVKFWGI